MYLVSLLIQYVIQKFRLGAHGIYARNMHMINAAHRQSISTFVSLKCIHFFLLNNKITLREFFSFFFIIFFLI